MYWFPSDEVVHAQLPHATAAIAGFLATEEMLAEAIQYVPYCAEHLDVWSPRFATIILEAASQTDSLWHDCRLADGHKKMNRRITVDDYRALYADRLAMRFVVFFGGHSAAELYPYDAWRYPPTFGRPHPRWWTAYNKLKHSRLANIKRATLRHATDAVGGLLCAIATCGRCEVSLLNMQLLEADTNPGAASPTGFLKDWPVLPVKPPGGLAKVETKLFAHLFGAETHRRGAYYGYWHDVKSARFAAWYAGYSKRMFDPPAAP